MTLFGNPVSVNELNGGEQRKYSFPNGYGASVIRSRMSYGGDQGLWELAVMGKDGHICYDTPITPDVVGGLDEAGVEKILHMIEALTDAKASSHTKEDLPPGRVFEAMESLTKL